ncbi:proton channel OtopLc-like [Anneissia japonica]|uniref:proton channel OtopLc-like n=1 Tax=Anneissia japonica TaxID=1529436 RepID=UPI00142592C8|nr:proton channel OtopLc-like [Anneissia japonica]
MYMIMSVGIMLNENAYNRAYESIIWVCFYLAQLIYLDRYSQVRFRKFLIYNRFGIMHLLATDILFWFDIVVYDTKEDYQHPTIHPFCNSSAQDNQDVGSARTYVGAFAVEYCFIAVCLLSSMWSNIGRTVIRRNTENISKHTYPIMKSLYGIIGGVLVLSLIIALGVCVFIRLCPLCGHYFNITVIIYGLLSLCSLICMINTNLLEEREGEGGPKPEEFTSSVIYDGVLLMFCLSLFILQTMYTTVSLIIQYKTDGYTTYVIAVCLYFFFPISQAVLLRLWQTHTIDRSRRHRFNMNMIIFLTISNFALWIGEHYQQKLGQLFFTTETKVYGIYLWYIIHHITGPFLILYFFHSSVCLFEIWTLFGSV